MKKRKATAVWNGTGKEGSGNLSTESGALNKISYSWAKRFGDEAGTNPEELIAAAHAGCYSMKLSFLLVAEGFTADKIETTSTITLDNGAIMGSHLEVKATVPGISKEKFEECAANAKANCPVSKALASIAITMEATLTEVVNA